MAQQEKRKPRFALDLNQRVLYFLVSLAVVTSIASALRNPSGWDDEWISGWLQNFSTEIMGAFATFILFELIIGRRQKQEAEERAAGQHKQRLITQMRSKDNATALNAVDELRELGWLQDGSLQGAFLVGANLQEAYLGRANLHEADLSGANLQGADLSGANLQEVGLSFTNLYGARLRGANLQEAELDVAEFDEKTALPDDSSVERSFWTPDTDMVRFTDPDHPDFWRSDDLLSPAFGETSAF
jgi:hypothetical protein